VKALRERVSSKKQNKKEDDEAASVFGGTQLAARHETHNEGCLPIQARVSQQREVRQADVWTAVILFIFLKYFDCARTLRSLTRFVRAPSSLVHRVLFLICLGLCVVWIARRSNHFYLRNHFCCSGHLIRRGKGISREEKPYKSLFALSSHRWGPLEKPYKWPPL
jgi:hypothetical protein